MQIFKYAKLNHFIRILKRRNISLDLQLKLITSHLYESNQNENLLHNKYVPTKQTYFNISYYFQMNPDRIQVRLLIILQEIYVTEHSYFVYISPQHIHKMNIHIYTGLSLNALYVSPIEIIFILGFHWSFTNSQNRYLWNNHTKYYKIKVYVSFILEVRIIADKIVVGQLLLLYILGLFVLVQKYFMDCYIKQKLWSSVKPQNGRVEVSTCISPFLHRNILFIQYF